MEAISELSLRNNSAQLQEQFGAFFQELQDLMSTAQHWPITASYKKSSDHTTIVRRDKGKGSPCYLQRSSVLTEVLYDDLRSVLFLNHSMNEPKYIDLMQDVRELFRLPYNLTTPGDAAVYRLAYKAALADGREFIELVVTQERTRNNGKREFMVVSKPVNLTSDILRHGFVRGQYEAWELVTETDEGAIEWKCIQRSDPGGWVPKWLADKVTAKELPKDVDSVLSYLRRR